VSADVGKVFVRTGADEAPTVLLLHGYPSSSFDFRAVLSQLAGSAWLTMDEDPTAYADAALSLLVG
jgi:pimeloyl-ACP methyl ester carboxylesterase